jgi:putative ABC transport system permease protein
MWSLAWHNLTHDRLRFAVTIIGIAVACFLMVYQISLLLGFTLAASRIVDSSNSDIWIAAHGAPCYDHGGLLEERYKDLALGVPGITEVGRLVNGWISYQSPLGERHLNVMVGVDSNVAGRLPHPRLLAGANYLRADILADRAEADSLGILEVPAEVEINSKRAKVVGLVSGFTNFIGSPYLFADYADAKDYLRIPAESTVYLLVKVEDPNRVLEIRDELRRTLPGVDVWTRSEFSHRSRVFWLTQSGAGGALSLAALLGFLIGLAVVSQTMYATTIENIDEFATLKAIGASRWAVRSLVSIQALACSIAGTILGFLAVNPAIEVSKRFVVSWIISENFIFIAVGVLTLLMCFIAALIAARPAMSVEPAKVFRA